MSHSQETSARDSVLSLITNSTEALTLAIARASEVGYRDTARELIRMRRMLEIEQQKLREQQS